MVAFVEQRSKSWTYFYRFTRHTASMLCARHCTEGNRIFNQERHPRLQHSWNTARGKQPQYLFTHGYRLHRASENLIGDTLFQLGESPDLMAASGAANVSVVGMVFAEVEVIIPTNGACEFDTHAARHTPTGPLNLGAARFAA